MGVIRILLFVVIIWLVYRLVKNKLQGPPAKNGKSTRQEYGRMVRCGFCGVHLPQSQALQEGDAWYCNPTHRAKAQQNADHRPRQDKED